MTGGVDAAANPFGVSLIRTDDRSGEITALADRWGDRVGLEGVLSELEHVARPGPVPAPAAAWGFRLDPADDRSLRWWPQGITTSADADPTGRVLGRTLVLTSAYSKEVAGVQMGSRVTVTDVSDRRRVRYQHVLLVEVVVEEHALVLRPVTVHAGGLAWHGRNLHVAATARGLCVFRLDDVLRVPRGGRRDRLDITEGRVPDTFGHRYVLPLRFRYAAEHASAVAPFRYSFVSVDRSALPPELVAGEYGRDGASTRLLRYRVDPASRLLQHDWVGRSGPVEVSVGVPGMQGVAVVDGRYHVVTSAGSRRRGSLWVGCPGALQEHPGVLSVGPEDLAYRADTDELWTLSEYPGRRFVYALDRSRFR